MSPATLIKLLLAGAALWGHSMGFANPVFLFDVTKVGNMSLLSVSVGQIDQVGLAAAHIDLSYDTSRFGLVHLIAGDFFTANPLSTWSDSSSPGLVAGASLDGSVTNAANGPDVLGVDLLELTGNASFQSGKLFEAEFAPTGSVASFDFRFNDALLIDSVGTSYPQSPTIMSVPEPSSLPLAAIALGALALMGLRRTQTSD